MLKIKDNVDLKELEKFGFVYQYKYYENYDNGKPISWWNDGRDKEQYRYYQYGYDKYDITLIVEEKDKSRKLNCYAPFDEFNTEDTETHLDLLYNLIKADLVEKVDE